MKNLFLSAVLLSFTLLKCVAAPAFISFNNLEINEPDSTVVSDSVSTVEWVIESDFSNKYLWRGIEFQDALTWNPNINFGYKNFSTNVWANIPVHYYNEGNKELQDFREIDVNFNYEIENEVSYTMISHSAQLYTPLGQGDWYWGMVNVFQGFYKGPIGFYINPEVNYYPYAGGLYIESGLNYNIERDNSTTTIYLAYTTANKIFTAYNICGDDATAYTVPFQTVKFDASYQYNFKSFFIRPHFSYFHLINYTEELGYKNTFSFGLGIGFNKN